MKRHLNLYYDSQNSLKLQVYFFFLPSLDRDYGRENFMYNWQVLYLFAVWRGHLNCTVGIPMVKVFLIFRFTLPRETAGLLKKICMYVLGVCMVLRYLEKGIVMLILKILCQSMMIDCEDYDCVVILIKYTKGLKSSREI